MSRTLVLSTTFPQYPGDPRGQFILRYWEARAAAGEEVRVLAPRSAWCPGAEPGTGVQIRRVAYAPRGWSTLTGHFGILENIRERPGRALLVPLLWRSLRASLLEEIRWRRPDRIAAHMLLPAGWIVAEACREAKIPYVLFGHGTDVDLSLRLPALLRRRLLGHLEAAEAVYVPSEDKRRRLLGAFASGGVGSGAGGHLQVEMMSEHIVPAAPVSGSADPVRASDILYLGRLIRQKGVEDLLAAVSLMRPRPRLDIAGDGPERRRLERLAARLGVAARFHGFVEGDDKVELLSGARVLCVPSRETPGGLSEGAPLVIREAFAYGVPVVATRVGGIPELCRSGGAARLVPAGRPSALSEALRSVLAEPRPARPPTAAASLC